MTKGILGKKVGMTQIFTVEPRVNPSNSYRSYSKRCFTS